MSSMMKAALLVGLGRIEIADKPILEPSSNDALIRITTTIFGAKVHTRKSTYPVAWVLTVGHKTAGVIERRDGLHRRPARDRPGHLPQLQRLRSSRQFTIAGRQLPGTARSVRLPWLQRHRRLAL